MTFINLGEWLARRELLTPDKIGLIESESGTRLTYRDLNLRARALATLLARRYRIRQGERVAVLALNAPEYLDAFFACALLGAVLVPLNWRLALPELVTILRDCEPELLLHDASHAQRASEIADGLRASSELALLAFADFPGAASDLAALAEPFVSADGEEPAVIVYTSGTTGVPKGAIRSHRMITWNAINTQISWGLRETDITPTFAPFFHAGGLNVLTTPLYHLGGTVVLLRNSDPQAVLHVIERERCTIPVVDGASTRLQNNVQVEFLLRELCQILTIRLLLDLNEKELTANKHDNCHADNKEETNAMARNPLAIHGC